MHVAQPPQACPPKLFLSSIRCLFPRFWDTPNKAHSHTVRPEQAAPQAGLPDRVVSSACCPPKAAQTHCLTQGSVRCCLIVLRLALPLPIWPWDPYLNKIHITTPIEYMFPGILLGNLHDQVTR